MDKRGDGKFKWICDKCSSSIEISYIDVFNNAGYFAKWAQERGWSWRKKRMSFRQNSFSSFPARNEHFCPKHAHIVDSLKTNIGV